MSVDGEAADWLREPKGDINKVNLTFTAKFLWLIVRHCLSPTAADNIVTLDRAVRIVEMIAGFEVDFSWLLQAVMPDSALRVTTTYPFPCMVFDFSTYACVSDWHIYHIKTPPGTIDIGLIRD